MRYYIIRDSEDQVAGLVQQPKQPKIDGYSVEPIDNPSNYEVDYWWFKSE